MDQVKNWIKAHPRWSLAIGLIAGFILLGILGGEEEKTPIAKTSGNKPSSQATEVKEKQPSETPRPGPRTIKKAERLVDRQVKRALREIKNRNAIGPPLIDVACKDKSLKLEDTTWVITCTSGLVLASIPGQTIVEDEWIVLIDRKGKQTAQLNSDYQLNQFYVSDKALDCSGSAALVSYAGGDAFELVEAIEPCVP